MSATAATLEVDNLRLVFFRQGDRYAHRVEVRDTATGEWGSALESLEGSESDKWPPSPPFQQLHVEQRPSGDVILLVGMAGRTHWSAAVEVADNRQGFMFDVAARLQGIPERLGSAYKRAGESHAQKPLSFRSPPLAEVPATTAWRYTLTHRDVT